MRPLKKISLCLLLLIPALFLAAGCGGFKPDETPAPHVTRLGVCKKGVDVSRYNPDTQENADRINSLGAGWYYNWGSAPENSKIEAEYVPMVWGAGSVNSHTLQEIREGYQAGEYNYLLTFNEPDVRDQSNMTVDQAIALWPQLEALGIPLSSPATSYPIDTGKWTINTWFDDFMTRADELGLRIDFIAVHCYQDFSRGMEAVNELRDVLMELYQRYEKPIWITEFGNIDIKYWGTGKYDPACNYEAAAEYTTNVTKMLESFGAVERYAWFLDNFGEHGDDRPKEAEYTALFNDDDTISEIGKLYRDARSAEALRIETGFIAGVKENEFFNMKLRASGGTGDYSFTVYRPAVISGRTMPPNYSNIGLSVSKSGEVYGTPIIDGEYEICVYVTDSAGQAAFKIFRITIESA